MMTLTEILLVAVALAMDCFTVSIVSGVILQRRHGWNMLRMAFFFGLFQSLMPLLGWLAIHFFQHSVEAYDHWIAFAMLSAIGVKMIKDSFSGEENAGFNPLLLRTQLALAVATSIDALAIGISMSCSGYDSAESLPLPLAIIGVVSFVFSIAGNLLGVRFGAVVSRKIHPELFGGIILIGIGVRIMLEHLLV